MAQNEQEEEQTTPSEEPPEENPEIEPDPDLYDVVRWGFDRSGRVEPKKHND